MDSLTTITKASWKSVYRTLLPGTHKARCTNLPSKISRFPHRKGVTGLPITASIVRPKSSASPRSPRRPSVQTGPAGDEDRRKGRMETTLAGRTNNAAAASLRAQTRVRRSPPALPSQGSPLSEFAELYDQYFPKVFAYVYGRVQHKEASLDIVSDVFEKAFVKKQSLRSAEAFGSWLFTIAPNELNNKPPSPEDTLLHRERVHHLVALLRQLPPREQEIISLKFDAELTNREIAAILNTSEVNVRVTIFRALRKLRDRMEQQQEVR